MIRLVDVYGDAGKPRAYAMALLYTLLEQRRPEENISHRTLPGFDEHKEFVASRPYLAWYIVHADAATGEANRESIPVGATYLTKKREIGVFILEAQRRQLYATDAVMELRRLHPGPCLANINPSNEKSIALFHKLGARHLQNTYELP